MSIEFLGIPALNVGHILNDDNIAVDVVVREANFVMHEGLQVTDFWVECSGEFQPIFYKDRAENLVLVEKEAALSSFSKDHVDALLFVSDQIKKEAADWKVRALKNQEEVLKLSMQLEEAKANQRNPWWSWS